MTRDRDRRNPLILDPDDYEKLGDEDFLDEETSEDRELYEPMDSGSRRRKPLIDTDF
jgi:hypothetical protein